MKNILVIAPHADDEVLGCGATIAKLATSGLDVHVLICTDASVGAPELFTPALIQKLRNEALSAHRLLGVKETRFLDLPAPALDQYPGYKIAGDILSVVRELDIDTAFIPHRGDCHKDHRAVHEAAMVALRPLAGSRVRRVYAYETLSETEWGEPVQADAFVPTKFVTFTEEEFGKKLDAMARFQSQLQPFPCPRSLEALEALAKLRGACVSSMRAESFEVLREID